MDIRWQDPWTLVVACWTCLVLAGVLSLGYYDNRPAAVTPPPARFPMDSTLTRQAGRPLLLTFAHPKCPCTRATLYNLETIATRYARQIDIWFVCMMPQEKQATWRQASLPVRAATHKQLNVFEDVDGVEARRFHVGTSGETVLYDAQGSLVFSGGLTVGRGHAGESRGTQAIESFLTGSGTIKNSAVFGCRLFEKQDEGACNQCRMEP